MCHSPPRAASSISFPLAPTLWQRQKSHPHLQTGSEATGLSTRGPCCLSVLWPQANLTLQPHPGLPEAECGDVPRSPPLFEPPGVFIKHPNKHQNTVSNCGICGCRRDQLGRQCTMSHWGKKLQKLILTVFSECDVISRPNYPPTPPGFSSSSTKGSGYAFPLPTHRPHGDRRQRRVVTVTPVPHLAHRDSGLMLRCVPAIRTGGQPHPAREARA